MELNAATDYLGTNELLCDITAEQPVEGEFTIPDYQPEIFKIVKAKAEPIVVQKLAVGSRATVDGYVRLTVIYQSETEQRLYALTQKLPFSKQTDLKEPVDDNSVVLCNATMSYLNCRAVNSRRIDVRGAANIAIKVLSGAGVEVVSDVTGDGAQQQQQVISFVRQIGMDEKQFTLDEALSLDFEDNAEPSILRCDAKAYAENVSVENGRVAVTGAINVMIALDLSTEDDYRIKRAGFSLPFSQLVDIENATETSKPIAALSVLSASAEIEEDDVVNTSILCALEVRAYEEGSATLVSDVFSTQYELNIEQDIASVTRDVTPVSKEISVRQTIEKPVVGAKLIDYFIMPTAANYQKEDDATIAHISTIFSYLLRDPAGDIVCWDHPIEVDVDVDGIGGTPYSALDVVFATVECSETDDSLNLKAEGSLYGSVISVGKQTVVRAVTADTSHAKARPDIALSIYYADAGERIFDIAKAFNTSPIEITRENNISDGVLAQKSMLLIPIVE